MLKLPKPPPTAWQNILNSFPVRSPSENNSTIPSVKLARSADISVKYCIGRMRSEFACKLAFKGPGIGLCVSFMGSANSQIPSVVCKVDLAFWDLGTPKVLIAKLNPSTCACFLPIRPTYVLVLSFTTACVFEYIARMRHLSSN